jgi:outer membrane lipoprotein SlyB
MDKPNTPQRLHPLVAGAAISVMLASLTGIAAMTGLLPTSHGESRPTAEQSTVQPQAPKAAPPANVATLAQNDEPAPQRTVESDSRPAAAPVAQPDYSQHMVRVAQPAHICHDCGRVVSIRAVQTPANASGVGVVGGAVVGGLLGNQVGSGNGRTLATIAGAVGGGYAGNEVEKRTRSHTGYEVSVRMQDGRMRSFPYNKQPPWHVGDQVRVENGYLRAER